MTLAQLQYAIAVAKEHTLNDAAKKLFMTQPSLSASIRSLEKEIGFAIFIRGRTGIMITPRGKEFLGYARSVVEQYEILDSRFVSHTQPQKHFSVSMQHYTFAVDSFVELIKRFGMEEYELEIHETRTYEVIQNVKTHQSEIGVLYMNDFNRDILHKLLKESSLVFYPLFTCGIYAYLWKNHPLADRKIISLSELDEYPCLAFSQGEHNSHYFSEEVLSTYQYKRFIRANDRATLLNLMVGLNGFTLCSGILCEKLNGDGYRAVKLDSDETMTIGYIIRKNAVITQMGKCYLQELCRYQEYSI